MQVKNSFGGGLPIDVSFKLKGRVGQKNIKIDRNEISQVPLHLQTNIRSLACALTIAKSTLHQRIKEGDNIRSHTNALNLILLMKIKCLGLHFV